MRFGYVALDLLIDINSKAATTGVEVGKQVILGDLEISSTRQGE
tara:strand:+ start:223 stop:354 length:132 start_codon:yes stop_codon:yes gene_type:complete